EKPADQPGQHDRAPPVMPGHARERRRCGVPRLTAPFAQAAPDHAEPQTPGRPPLVQVVLDQRRQLAAVRFAPRPRVPAEQAGGLHAGSSPSRARPARVTRRMSASAAASAAEPGGVMRYGRRRSSSLPNGSIRPRSASRVIAPYKAPGPSLTPAKSSMSLASACPCFGPSARLTRMSRGGSFGLRSPLGDMPSFYYAPRSYARRNMAGSAVPSASPARSATCWIRRSAASAERVGDPDAAVVLAVAEVLGQDERAAQRAGGLDDRGVPVRKLKTLAGVEGSQHDAARDVLDGEAPERLDEQDRLPVADGVGAARPGRLDVELLQYLH